MNNLTAGLIDRIEDLAAQLGSSRRAVSDLQDQLDEAKAIAERIKGERVNVVTVAQLEALIKATVEKQVIPAIKLIREMTALDLREAKDVTERAGLCIPLRP